MGHSTQSSRSARDVYILGSRRHHLNSEGRKINDLLKKAAENAGKDRLQQAVQSMLRARLIARKSQDKRLIEQGERNLWKAQIHH